jgi:ATP-dependent DNA ligase
MANDRPEDNKAAQNKATQNKATQNVDETVRRAGERSIEQTQRTVEQTRRIGLAAAQVSEEVAQASTHLFQENAEMLQNSWRFGVELATTMLDRSTDHLGRTLGMTAGDEAQKATERSARNAEAIAYSRV